MKFICSSLLAQKRIIKTSQTQTSHYWHRPYIFPILTKPV